MPELLELVVPEGLLPNMDAIDLELTLLELLDLPDRELVITR